MNGDFAFMLKRPILYPLCHGEFRRSQILFLASAILVNASTILTTGTFLSGYIVLLEGSDFLVGILNNSATWTSVAAIFSFIIFERIKKRKKLLLTLSITSRVMVCSIVFVPLLHTEKAMTLAVVTVMVIVGNLLWSIYSIGYTVWLIGIMPKENKTDFIYLRQFWLRISFTVSSLFMGYVIDWFNKSYTGFMIVFSFSLIVSLMDAIVILNTKEPEYALDGNRSGMGAFFEPVKDLRFRSYMLFVFSFYLSLSISSSFTSLYLIRYLEFDYSFISIVNVIAYIFMVVCTKFWGKVAAKKGLKFVFITTSLFKILEFLIYGFLTKDTYFILYFAPIISGIGNSGFNVSVMEYRYEIMPEQNKTIYEGWHGAVFGMSTLISPIIGSFMLKIIPDTKIGFFNFSDFQLMYIISFALAGLVILFLLQGPAALKFEDCNVQDETKSLAEVE